MPPTITNHGNLIEMVRTGDSPVTMAIVAGFAAVTLGWYHFSKLKEPGHFDTICPDCAAQADPPLTAEDCAHIEEWSKEDRERARKLMVRSKEGRFDFMLKWRPGRKRDLSADYARNAGGVVLTGTQPRAD
jgi:hypothetical protein